MKDREQKFGRYTILKEIATGSFGKTFLARAPDGKKVILKVMHPHLVQELSARKRVEREIAILKQLNHPQIVKLIDSGEHEGIPFAVLEFVPGPTLREYLDQNAPLEEKEAIKIFRQLAIPVSYLHQQGVIHRDLKPENIVLRNGRPVIIDFGLARKMGLPSVTVDGSVIGTVHYIPPEVLNGQDYSPAGDVYALGVILYEMLTGKHPFEGESFGELVEQILEFEPNCPESVSEHTCNLLKALLNKDPAKRPELMTLLTEWTASPMVKSKMAVKLAFLAMFLMVAALTMMLFHSGKGQKTEQIGNETGESVNEVVKKDTFEETLTTPPPEARGYLKISVSEPTAISLNGSKFSLTGDTVLEVDTGRVKIAFSHPQYGELTRSLRVKSGTTSVSVNWSREVGFLFVKVKPWGELSIDGHPAGATPLKKPFRLVGNHILRIRHPIFGEILDTVNIPPGDTVFKTYAFSR